MSSKPKKTNAPKPQANAAKRETIGVANMLDDGTISLLLRAEGPGGAIGDAVLTYKRSDPKYAGILKHLGGLKPGQEKPVPPFP
jgi:hypothetical protein